MDKDILVTYDTKGYKVAIIVSSGKLKSIDHVTFNTSEISIEFDGHGAITKIFAHGTRCLNKANLDTVQQEIKDIINSFEQTHLL